MTDYKPINEMSYNECLKFLKENPESRYATAVEERKNVREKELSIEDDKFFSSCNSIEELQNYCSMYPKEGYMGKHIDESKYLIENKVWEENRASKSGVYYYLSRYPRGRYQDEAYAQLAKFKKRKVAIYITVSIIVVIILGIICLLSWKPASRVSLGFDDSLSKYGGDSKITFYSDAASDAAIDFDVSESWASITSYEGDMAILHTLPNPEDIREVKVTIRAYSLFFGKRKSFISDSIVIKQPSGIAHHLTTDISSMSFDKYGNKKAADSFVVSTDGAIVDIDKDINWIRIDSYRENGGKILCSLSVESNNSDYRTGCIYIKSGPLKKVVRIYQDSGLAHYLSVNRNSINASETLEDGHYYEIKVNTDGVTWSVDSDKSWLSVTKYSDDNMVAIVPSNNTGTVRIGIVTISSNNGHTEQIAVKQNGDPSNFTSNVSEFSPGPDSGSKTVYIENDSFYNITADVDKSWLNATVYGNSITIRWDSNSRRARKGAITVRCGNSTCSITVKQDGYKDCSRCGGDGVVHCPNSSAQWMTNYMTGETRHMVMVTRQYSEFVPYVGWMPRTRMEWENCSECGGDGKIKCPKCHGSKKELEHYDD